MFDLEIFHIPLESDLWHLGGAPFVVDISSYPTPSGSIAKNILIVPGLLLKQIAVFPTKVRILLGFQALLL